MNVNNLIVRSSPTAFTLFVSNSNDKQATPLGSSSSSLFTLVQLGLVVAGLQFGARVAVRPAARPTDGGDPRSSWKQLCVGPGTSSWPDKMLTTLGAAIPLPAPGLDSIKRLIVNLIWADERISCRRDQIPGGFQSARQRRPLCVLHHSLALWVLSDPARASRVVLCMR